MDDLILDTGAAEELFELVPPEDAGQRRRHLQEEHLEQVWLFARIDTYIKQAELAGEEWTPWSMIFAVPNGTAAGPKVGKYMVAEGVRRGVPDLLVAVPRIDSSGRAWPGYFIEMKKPKGGVVSIDQKRWLARLAGMGYKTDVCNTGRLALERIREYLSWQPWTGFTQK